MSSILIQPFKNAVISVKERFERLAAQGVKTLGYFCTYTPVEVVHAAGFLPMRLMGRQRMITRAGTLVPGFICPYLRRALEDALNGEYDFLTGVVQGYTCDAACGMVNIWQENIGGKVFHTVPLPYNDNPGARRFFKSVMLEMAEKLDRAGGSFSEESLDASLNLYGDIRRRVLDLYRMQYDGLLPFGAADFYTMVTAGFIMPPETFRQELGKLLAEIKEAAPGKADHGIPVVVSGSIVEDDRIFDIVEECGGRLAADDLCTGMRHFMPADGSGETPLDRLADRYIRRFPCPARARAVERAPCLTDLVRRSHAKGVVFLLQKFCTPHLADLPILKEALKKEGIPAMVFEMEETGLMEGQLRTRLESFFEMIGG